MIDLRNQPEVLEYDKAKPQILDADSYVENMFLAVGFASRCWKDKDGQGVFDTEAALRLANELCAYFRLVSKYPIDNLEYLEWKFGKLEGTKK